MASSENSVLARVDGWRIGIAPSTLDGCDPEVTAAFLDTLSVCRALGCRIVEIESPTGHDLEDANAAGLIVSRSEAGSPAVRTDAVPISLPSR